MHVGAVILTYRARRDILGTIDAVADEGVELVVVVDNASDDDTAHLVERERPHVLVIQCRKNGGYGAGMNAGGARARDEGADTLLFLTQECRLASGSLAVLAGELGADMVGVVGPLLALRSRPDIAWSAGGKLTRVLARPVHLSGGESVHAATGGTVREVMWLDGAALLVRADAFAAVGGFREDYFLYWEDIDFCLRLRAVGWRVECAPSAVAFQEPGMTPPYLLARNKLRFARQHKMYLAALGTVLEMLTLAGRDLFPAAASGRRMAAARIVGLRDAFTGALDRDRAGIR